MARSLFLKAPRMFVSFGWMNKDLDSSSFLFFFVHMLILTVCRKNDIKSLLSIPGWAWWVWLIYCWSLFLYHQVWMFIFFILPGFANEEGNLQHICHISSSYLVSDNAWTSAFLICRGSKIMCSPSISAKVTVGSTPNSFASPISRDPENYFNNQS